MKTTGQLLGYSAKLETEQWKAFAAGMRQSKGGACECCKQSNKVLQLHHFAYDPNRDPWEYGPDELALLCSECHRLLHEQLKQFRKFVFCKLTPQSMRVLNGALAAGLDNYDPLQLAYAIASLVASPGSVKRFCDSWKP